jgi:hypothetical protein
MMLLVSFSCSVATSRSPWKMPLCHQLAALEFVQPETVLGWQHHRFKRYWWKLSQPERPGRPRVRLEIRRLVRTYGCR